MTKSQTPARLPEIAGKIYDLLEPLDAAIRTKVLHGVLGLLGEATTSGASAASMATTSAVNLELQASSGRINGTKAAAWMRKHGITDEQLERVFHLDGNVELIVSPPGKTVREKTLNAYVLIGAQHFLQNDEAKFSESDAVGLCKRTGCHDKANHAMTRSRLGNRVTGSKDSGYTLTVPGLEQAAALIKTLAPA